MRRSKNFANRMVKNILLLAFAQRLVLKVIAGAVINDPSRGLSREYSEVLEDFDVKSNFTSPLPVDYIDQNTLPESFDWRNISGISYLTKAQNQHIPQVRTSGMNEIYDCSNRKRIETGILKTCSLLSSIVDLVGLLLLFRR